MALFTKAKVVEAFEEDGFLRVVVEIYVEDDKAEKLKVLSRSPLDPLPIDATVEDIAGAAGSYLEKYFPQPAKQRVERPDLVDAEVGSAEGVKDGVGIRTPPAPVIERL